MSRDRSRDIAVMGLSARFPGPPGLDAWWAAVTAGHVLTRRYEHRALADAGVPESLLTDSDYVPVHGHLNDAERFENELFKISPREAETLDPQHRLMLEVVWAALEDAGVSPRGTGPPTAVYASAAPSGYLRRMLARGPLDPATLEDALHGNEPDFMASRIAYKLGLTGPAIGVQCACSSSLVAVHMAVRALLDGDCDRVVVVGAGVAFPQAGYLYVPGGVLSASGRCRPFDAEADGTVAGSGVACVVLERLEDALARAADPHAVILGTAVNNDGSAKAGYYAPSVGGQETVIAAAVRAAEIDGASIGYLETHGTGTHVGDPIEWTAASCALAGVGARPGQVAVGAVKANIGHLDSAAGIANLIKAILVVRDGVVPPLAGFTQPNPLLETDGSPLFVPIDAQPWAGPTPRRAGISSFGIGGTNAHVVIEQAPERSRVLRAPADETRLLLVSAADAAALERSTAQLADHLVQASPDLADVSFTLATGRTELPERAAVVARTAAEAAKRFADGRGAVRGRASAVPAPIVYLFPGQGSQYPGMALPFAQGLPGFSVALEDSVAAFEPELSGRVARALREEDFPAAELEETELAQPALFAVEHAAAVAFSELGVRPAAVAGHSLGELTAACVAGALELADAARLVAARGRAMQACSAGAMLALGCTEARALELLAETGAALVIAAVNTPRSCVVSGPVAAIEAFEAAIGDTVFAKRLRTRRAFHSALIEPALQPLAEELGRVAVGRPAAPLASNASGRLVEAGEPLAPGVFVEQARRKVRFADALAAIADRFPRAVAVELGPGGVLSAMAEAAGLGAIPLSPVRAASAAEKVQAALGELWALGQPLAPAALCQPGVTIRLPTYPFAGPTWIAPEARPAPMATAPAVGDSDGRGLDTPLPVTSQERPLPDPAALMADLWEELLGRSGLDEDSDFFELGGDSLLITHLVRRINKELGVHVPIRDMLTGRTLGRQTMVVAEQLR
jgi:phthiocerol/phenolphthiocerol synthesis type-I polyketide synthase E